MFCSKTISGPKRKNKLSPPVLARQVLSFQPRPPIAAPEMAVQWGPCVSARKPPSEGPAVRPCGSPWLSALCPRTLISSLLSVAVTTDGLKVVKLVCAAFSLRLNVVTLVGCSYASDLEARLAQPIISIHRLLAQTRPSTTISALVCCSSTIPRHHSELRQAEKPPVMRAGRWPKLRMRCRTGLYGLALTMPESSAEEKGKLRCLRGTH